MHDTDDRALDPTAYDELDQAIERLVYLAWDRWHPRNPDTEGTAPADVYAALRDVRAISHELEALWVLVGNRAHGLGRVVPDRDLKFDDGLPDEDVLDDLVDEADDDQEGADGGLDWLAARPLHPHPTKGDVA